MSIITSIEGHSNSFDSLTVSIRALFTPVVKGVLKENGNVHGSYEAFINLQSKFDMFKSDAETKAHIKQEDVDYIIKIYRENFNIQANEILKENNFMRESFDFDKYA